MRAITYTRTGAPDVLQPVDRDEAAPGPGEVRVRVVVSGVNPTDWKSRDGGAPGQELPFPEVVPNQDGSGIVDAVGPDVTDLAVGDRVWIMLAA
ncbi:alcohol dehydrogenase catalytic domain-containing protein, partial [Clavibacter phaseoli]